MEDKTEEIRKHMTHNINSQVESNDKSAERERLEKLYGKVWNTEELSNEFEVIGFMAPYVACKRKSDGREGAIQFQHSPRLYFNFQKSPI